MRTVPRTGATRRGRRARLGRLFSLALAPAATLTLTAGAAAAQGAPSQTVALAAGWTTPRGALADSLKRGYNIVGSIAFHFAAQHVSLRFDALYNQLPHLTDNRQQQVLAFSGNLELSPMGDVSGPYVVGGYGSFQAEKPSGSTGTANWEWGYNGGAGLRLVLMSFSLFGEARYYAVRGTPRRGYLPISIGVRL